MGKATGNLSSKSNTGPPIPYNEAQAVNVVERERRPEKMGQASRGTLTAADTGVRRQSVDELQHRFGDNACEAGSTE